MADADYTVAPLDAWQASMLRLTAFGLVPLQGPVSEWWGRLVGESPESVVTQPKIGSHRSEGPFQYGKLTLDVQANRIEWRYDTHDDLTKWPGDFPTVGGFVEARTHFVAAMTRWLRECEPINRLAFGAHLLLPVDRREESYSQLSRYLRLQLDPDGSSDFQYRINRPRMSKAIPASIKINRLSTWSCYNIKVFANLQSQSSLMFKEWFNTSVEFDINTDGERKEPLDHESLPGLFAELADLAGEIAERGDVP